MLDDIHDIDDLSDIAIAAMTDRLERSVTPEHFVYRETELDEMWRLVDMALLGAGSADARARLARLKAAVMRAHDLVGVDGLPREAAEALRSGQP